MPLHVSCAMWSFSDFGGIYFLLNNGVLAVLVCGQELQEFVFYPEKAKVKVRERR